jgi:AraC family carnitine catabolism transcriptional activator
MQSVVYVLVVPPVSDLDCALVLDILRLANGVAGEALFTVRILTPNSQPVMATNGRPIIPNAGYPEDFRDLLIVLNNLKPSDQDEDAAVRVLRRAARSGGIIMGIEYGALLMARSGILDDHRATTHFDCLPMAQESFPNVDFGEELYVKDRNCFTCAGHLAIVDMMLHYIKSNLSETVAATLASELLAPEIRQPQTPQRVSLLDPFSTQRDPRLKKAIIEMQNNLESPLSLNEIADRVGISARQLQNLWRTKLGSSHNEYYQDLRLDRARSLLLNTDMQISEIAIISGFSSSATFSRAFKSRSGSNPRDFRAEHQNSLSPMIQRNALRTISSIAERNDGFLYRCLNDHPYTVLYVTRGIERLLGYSAAAFINSPTRNMSSVIHPDDLGPMRQIVDTALENNNNWDIEFRYLHRDGNIVWVHEVGCGVFDNNGRLIYLEGMIVRNLNPPEQYIDAMSSD